MKLCDVYKNQVIHLKGGFQEYIGKLTEHPLGKDWLRIEDPCLVFFWKENPNNPESRIKIRLHRITDSKTYLNFIDTITVDIAFEIKVLDTEGWLYKTYMKELERPDAERIMTPDHPDFGKTIEMANYQRGQQKERRKKR